jgi:CBS domain-containing protein
VIKYLAWINGILAVFNLVPAFPLDGGRILRAALWGWKNDLRWATRIAAGIGSGFGLFLIFMGILQFFGGNLSVECGGFLSACLSEVPPRCLTASFLCERRCRGAGWAFMKKDPVTVPPSTTVEELVEDFIYRHQFKLFPVVEEGNRLRGCVTMKQVKEIPREEWQSRTAGEIAIGCSSENSIDLQADAMEALALMTRTGSSRLMVTEGNRLAGIISLKDMMKFFELKVELEP